MAFPQTDETFFIESDEILHSRIDPRTAAKMIARNRQDIIAGELSRLAGEEYLEDIMLHMRHMEARYNRSRLVTVAPLPLIPFRD